ncbi:MAG: hypothetical protein JW908_09010 [Anaerolineales bacterium]|nr:hypothetical protein [Anaerolineales bacterium]
MKNFFAIILLAVLTVSCASLPYEEVIQTSVAGTLTALPTSTFSIHTTPLPTTILPSLTPLPTITDHVPVPTETPTPTDIVFAEFQIGQQATCGNRLIAVVPEAPEFNKDLFEHHAEGTFLIIKLALINTSDQPIQIWDGDYSIEIDDNGLMKDIKPHRAATTYLFIQRGGKLMQDLVEPGVMNWETNLAFDVDPQAQNWKLIFKPGFEGGQALCELHFNLTNPG